MVPLGIYPEGNKGIVAGLSRFLRWNAVFFFFEYRLCAPVSRLPSYISSMYYVLSPIWDLFSSQHLFSSVSCKHTTGPRVARRMDTLRISRGLYLFHLHAPGLPFIHVAVAVEQTTLFKSKHKLIFQIRTSMPCLDWLNWHNDPGNGSSADQTALFKIVRTHVERYFCS